MISAPAVHVRVQGEGIPVQLEPGVAYLAELFPAVGIVGVALAVPEPAAVVLLLGRKGSRPQGESQQAKQTPRVQPHVFLLSVIL